MTGKGAPVERRAFLVGVGASALALVGLTAGQSFHWLAPFNAFAPRQWGTGPQNLPVNRTAEQAAVGALATASHWQLSVRNGTRMRRFGRRELEAMPQTEAVLPIACVEGWSTSAHWQGVRLKHVLDSVGAAQAAAVRITSLEPKGYYRVTHMPAEYVRDDTTLVALAVNGAPLDLDHGYPARIIAPGRPGVLQTKWLASIEVIS
ncbi:molybdopterin-dependent oxidoreductase [Leifsonia sp. Root112D2]|uniref:molybdopterin-dependent oxidoreductase n=1 Tax=Leifsonia sp. Root112D2 TaxID=1736426 RepID=UPI000ADE618D|nr:molybdopterin-dependent oxidoreductase [Leifsonia sp. Root112D2]